MRTFETARLLRVNRCKLDDMTDEELTREIALNTDKPSITDFNNHKPTPWGAADTVPDISKTSRSASRCEKGVRPYSGLSKLIN